MQANDLFIGSLKLSRAGIFRAQSTPIAERREQELMLLLLNGGGVLQTGQSKLFVTPASVSHRSTNDVVYHHQSSQDPLLIPPLC